MAILINAAVSDVLPVSKDTLSKFVHNLAQKKQQIELPTNINTRQVVIVPALVLEK